MDYLRNCLTHPSMRGLNVNDPKTTELRRTIIKTNSFLRKVYESWYGILLNKFREINGRILELGSGGGFLAEIHPKVVTSEVFYCSHVQIILNGETLPFSAGTLSAIVMTNVLHHIPNVRKFFREAARCLHPGGSIALIEPWLTPWSRFVYGHLHHEPFDPITLTWEFPATGHLSAANGALPWIVFERDRAIFESEFPEFQIQTIQPIMPFRYLVSGGVSMRPLMPSWSYHFWSNLENMLKTRNNDLAMFAYINISKVDY